MGGPVTSSPSLRGLPLGARPYLGFATRLLTLAGFLGAEILLATILWDGDAPVRDGQWLAAAVHTWAPWALRFAIAFAGIFATFAYLGAASADQKAALQRIGRQAASARINLALLAAHAIFLAIWTYFSAGVYGDGLNALSQNQAAAGWLVTGLLSLAALLFALFAASWWKEVVRITGRLCILAAGAAGITVAATALTRSLWRPAASVTFSLVRWMLSPFTTVVVFQPERLLIGSRRFKVIISDQCSGLEGIGLLLAFSLLWLVLFRHEIRFPQALAILPVGMVSLFLLNSVRIAALVLIGSAGAKEIATGGFHSQAGWILFNSVAFGLCWVAGRVPWITRTPATRRAAKATESNPVTAYLLPFVAILVAAMLSRAASGKFEWLYSLRFFAAAAALWTFRGVYRKLDWRFGWAGLSAGVAVFLLWAGLDRMLGKPHADMPLQLASASVWLRSLWIVLRCATAVIAAPLAEELAFRGFLTRRLISASFEAVSFRTLRWVALGVSSLAFGLMHGDRWIAGSLAGLLYGLAVQRTGRLGESIAAHALTNALLALLVLAGGNWQLW